ncbi:MAG: amino acid permease [Metamycoplasmataceae bacterium]
MTNKQIGIIGFFSLTATSLMSMVLYPTFASSGFNLIFFMVIAAFFWFIPVAICSAEMGSVIKWKKGGIFEWSKNTMNEKWGFAAVFFQWFQTTVIYTIFFYFLLSGISYIFDTSILNSNIVQFFVIVAAFLFVNFLNIFGLKITIWISRISLPVGVILPTILLIIFSFCFVFITKNGELPPKLDISVLPKDNIFEFVIFSSFLLSMTAIEVSANTINVLKNSKKTYPIVIGMVVITLVTLNTLAGISIAIVLPIDEIQLSNAVFLTFDTVIRGLFGPSYIWISKIISFLIIIGIIGQVSTIIVEPSIGFSNSIKTIGIWSWLNKENKWGVKYNMFLIQILFMIFWFSLLNFLPSNNNLVMTICISITSGTYLFAYVLLFLSYLILTWKYNDLERKFSIKNKIVKTIIASIGLVLTIGTIIIIFFKPTVNLEMDQYIIYISILLSSLIIIFIAPLVLYKIFKKKKIKKENYLKN